MNCSFSNNLQNRVMRGPVMYQKVCIIYSNICFVYHKNLVTNGQLVIEIISFEVGWLWMCGLVLLFTKNKMASHFTLNQTHHAHMHACLVGDWHDCVILGVHIELTFLVLHYCVHSEFSQTMMWHQILFDSNVIHEEVVPYLIILT